jgi:mRNA interferase MazF
MKPFPKHICVSPIRRMMPMIGPTRTSGSVKQYEIWWAALPKPAGRRRVLLLSRDDAYSVLNKFIAAEITATVRHIPIEVPLGSTEGMPKPCVVNCGNLRTISKVRLVKKISKLSAKRVHEVKRAVGYASAWEELIDAGE